MGRAPEDFTDTDETRRLLRDLREIRQSKIRDGISLLDDTHLQMENLGALEINELRPLFSSVADNLRIMNLEKPEPAGDL